MRKFFINKFSYRVFYYFKIFGNCMCLYGIRKYFVVRNPLETTFLMSEVRGIKTTNMKILNGNIILEHSPPKTRKFILTKK